MRIGTLVGVEADALVLRDIEGFEPSLFRLGWASLADGRVLPIRAVVPDPQTGAWRVELAGAAPSDAGVETEVRLSPGCDLAFATCRDRFGNAANFRGFPHIPGTDNALGVAKSDMSHDGTPWVP